MSINTDFVRIVYGGLNFKKLKKRYNSLISEGANINDTDWDYNTLLMNAVLLGKYEFTKLLLSDKNIDINKKNNNGYTAITIGLFKMENKTDRIKICELLLKKKVDLDLVNKDGYTPLCLASKLGDIEAVKLLLKFEKHHKYYNHISNTNTTPLIEASKNGYLEIVKLLLEKKNNPGLYYKDDYGDCAFLHSCRNSNLEIVKLLLRKKNIKAKNDYNENALIISLKNNNKNVTKFLLENKKIDVNIIVDDLYNPINLCCKYGYLEELEILIKKGADINYVNCSNYTGFMYACMFGDVDIVKLLLKNNVDIDNFSKDGKNGFILACIGGNIEVVKLLLEIDSKIVDRTGKYNITPFMHSCIHNQVEVGKLLIACSEIDINKKDVYGSTALMYAVRYRNIEIVKLLLENNADVKIKNNQGDDVMTTSLKNSDEKIALLLFDKYECNNYEKLLLSCCDKSLTNVAKLIINKPNINLDYYKHSWYKILDNSEGIDIDCFNTPLVISCQQKNLDLIKNLIENGANVNLPVSSCGKTVLMLYCHNSAIQILEIGKLLLLNTDLEYVDSENKNILMHICTSRFKTCEKLELINLIIEKVDVNKVDKYNKTALDYALETFTRIFNDFVIISTKYLLDNIEIFLLLGISNNELEELLINWLNRINRKISKDCFKKILEMYFKNDYENLLIRCCKDNLNGFVKLLIDNSNLNINFKDKDGKTALDIVFFNTNDYLKNLLLKNSKIYISYDKIDKYFCKSNNIYVDRSLRDHKVRLKIEKRKNLRKLLFMKKTSKTTFGGNILINNHDVRSYIGSFF